MNKFLTFAIAFMLVFTVFAKAQDQAKKKKPGFTLNDKTMADLGLSAEQKEKIKAVKSASSIEGNKLQTEGKALGSALDKSVDSLLSEPQRAKLVEIKEALKAENLANPALKKNFSYDQKTLDQLGLTPELKKQISTLAGANHIARWNNAQAWGKFAKKSVDEQLAVLTEDQKKKMEEMKKEIDDYNKSIQ